MLACPSYDPPTTRHGSLAGSKNGSPQQDLSMPPHTVRKQGCEGTPERNKQRRQREQAGPLPGSSLPYCSFMKWPKSSLVGTVQVVTAMPENQPHRAEIAKLLVARSARGQGVGTALMRHAAELSRRAGKRLLVLDTATGSEAERLYQRLGWTRVGVIPHYSLLPNGQ